MIVKLKVYTHLAVFKMSQLCTKNYLWFRIVHWINFEGHNGIYGYWIGHCLETKL